ncbi:FAD/NAD(P)-binding protein [Pseudogemmobacter sonorensis]|uniref:FAD/NAD(P)-binding protein n=1 Tax=Pseudogemmobacter sonorensis TaxID=2989681 RepID=UPI0036A33574
MPNPRRPSGRILRIAIIGAGPRGLGAIEAVLRHGPPPGLRVEITLLDPLRPAGAGPNFAPQDSPLCLLNIALRDLDLPPSPVGFPDFRDWLGPEGRDPDHFAPRARFGAWTAARLEALCDRLPGWLSLSRAGARVDGIAPAQGGWRLRAAGTALPVFDEVLLVAGQPPTRPDRQIALWQRHAARSGAELHAALPAEALLAAAKGWRGRTVAIRGLGLATLDALRVLTLGQGGRMAAGGYIASGAEPARILPFSRDGLPPWPKPGTAALDRRFDLTPAEIAGFEQALRQAMERPRRQVLTTLCAALAPPATRILGLCDAQAGARKVATWLRVERNRPGTQETRPGEAVLAHAIRMAEGAEPPDPGFVIGQIWRKLQPAFRRHFDLRQPEGRVAAALIGFDEGLKRYSYGPPLSVARELLALIEAGLVSLRVAEDPDIGMVPGGWRLRQGRDHVDAPVLVDAVLPAPVVETVTDPLFTGLRKAGHLHALPETGGARTDCSGRLRDPEGKPRPGLSLLGRLANGSVAASDSLHDCFGEGADRWAARVMAEAGTAALPQV